MNDATAREQQAVVNEIGYWPYSTPYSLKGAACNCPTLPQGRRFEHEHTLPIYIASGGAPIQFQIHSPRRSRSASSRDILFCYLSRIRTSPAYFRGPIDSQATAPQLPLYKQAWTSPPQPSFSRPRAFSCFLAYTTILPINHARLRRSHEETQYLRPRLACCWCVLGAVALSMKGAQNVADV